MKVRIAALTAVLALAVCGAGAQTAEKNPESRIKNQEAGTKPAAAKAPPGPTSASPQPKAAVASPSPKPAASPSPSPAASPTPNTQHPTPSATVTTPKGESVNITVNAAPPEPPKSNDWAAGVIGIALLVAAGFFGWKYAQRRGVTVPDALKKMGVEMPQDGAAQGARPLKPVPAAEPPLPSLAELPAAGAAVGSVVGSIPTPNTQQPTPSAAPYAGPPRLLGLEGPFAGEILELGETFTIGREADNALALTQDTTVSRRHAVVERQNGVWLVHDNGSSNGTYVNGVRVNGAQTLQSGDEIQIGASRLRFEG